MDMNAENIQSKSKVRPETAPAVLVSDFQVPFPRKESHLVRDFDTKGPVPMGKGLETGGVKQLMTCPYNESHRVGFGSFARHLMNCRQALPKEERETYVICEYNATHHMKSHVYEAHLKICREFREVQGERYQIPDGVFGERRKPIQYYESGDNRELAPVHFPLRKRQNFDDLSVVGVPAALPPPIPPLPQLPDFANVTLKKKKIRRPTTSPAAASFGFGHVEPKADDGASGDASFGASFGDASSAVASTGAEDDDSGESDTETSTTFSGF